MIIETSKSIRLNFSPSTSFELTLTFEGLCCAKKSQHKNWKYVDCLSQITSKCSLLNLASLVDVIDSYLLNLKLSPLTQRIYWDKKIQMLIFWFLQTKSWQLLPWESFCEKKWLKPPEEAQARTLETQTKENRPGIVLRLVGASEICRKLFPAGVTIEPTYFFMDCQSSIHVLF